jgi:hypothetical protein
MAEGSVKPVHAARHLGRSLRKDRRRDPEPGYMVIDNVVGGVIYGCFGGVEYSSSLEEVEAWTYQPSTLG